LNPLKRSPLDGRFFQLTRRKQMEEVYLPGDQEPDTALAAGEAVVAQTVETPPEVEWGKPMTVPYTSDHGMNTVGNTNSAGTVNHL
jgi:hypothetical protein